MSKQYNQTFIDSYSKEFPCFVKSRKGDNHAFCSVCCCDIKIAHGGICDLKDHIKSKKHKDYAKTVEKNSKIDDLL